MTDSIFVGRAAELEQLYRALDRARAGQSQIVFVAGEAGAGKTALVSEFLLRAEERDDRVIAALGQCNAQTGAGDAYLPFRNVLEILVGTNDDRQTATKDSATNSARLRDFVRVSGETLLDVGPDLIGLFVPGASLVAKLATTAARHTKLADKVAEQFADSPARTSPALDQQKIFEQYTNVLRALSRARPLILILDDLHWADTASLNLMFHLARSLESSRVLIIGTYRPDDVALGRGGERHPLEPILNELKRYYGNIIVDLSLARVSEGRAFIDALVDAEPNQLDERFRQQLFMHTDAHPLFTVELLRNLQERGDLVQDAKGKWTVSETLNWNVLPARVEGVIGERIARLDEDGRESLTVAAVMGFDFLAQVIGQVRQIPERDILKQLARDLGKRHQLVSEQGESRVGKNFLSWYRFSHALFQQYLYNRQSAAERRVMHSDVAAALRELYADHSPDIAVSLAHHYHEAGDSENTAIFATHAGATAAAAAATEQARQHYRIALLAWAELPETPENIRARIDTARKFSDMAFAGGGWEEQLALFEPLYALAQTLPMPDGTIGDPRLSAYMELLIGDAHYGKGDRSEGDRYYLRAISAAEKFPEDSHLQAIFASITGGLLVEQGHFRQGLEYNERALAIFAATPDRSNASGALIVASLAHGGLGEISAARDLIQERFAYFERTDNLTGQTMLATVLPLLDWMGGDPERSIQSSSRAIELAVRSQMWMFQNMVLIMQALAASALGQTDLARKALSEAQTMSRELGNPALMAEWLAALAVETLLNLGEWKQALKGAEDAILFARARGCLYPEALAQRVWAQALVRLDPSRWEDANSALQVSLQLFKTCEAVHEIARTHAVWGELLLHRDAVAARKHLEQAAQDFAKYDLKFDLARVRALLAT